MLAGIRDVILVCNERDIGAFKSLLGDGSKWGMRLDFVKQEGAKGIPDVLLQAKGLISDTPICLALGDNIFHGSGLSVLFRGCATVEDGAVALVKSVRDPQRFGVAEVGAHGQALSLEEKPSSPRSRLAITGLYFFDDTVLEKASSLSPSSRGELEVIDLLGKYMDCNTLRIEVAPRGTFWLDTGTVSAMHEAGSFVKSVQENTGLVVGSPEEVAWRLGWISDRQLETLIEMEKPTYGETLMLSLGGYPGTKSKA